MAFFTMFASQSTKDRKWGEHHIADEDKIDQLFASLEIAAKKNMLDEEGRSSLSKLSPTD
jgi:hypothetical protein